MIKIDDLSQNCQNFSSRKFFCKSHSKHIKTKWNIQNGIFYQYLSTKIHPNDNWSTTLKIHFYIAKIIPVLPNSLEPFKIKITTQILSCFQWQNLFFETIKFIALNLTSLYDNISHKYLSILQTERFQNHFARVWANFWHRIQTTRASMN